MSANFLLTSWNAGIKIRVTVMENHKKKNFTSVYLCSWIAGLDAAE